MQLRRHAEGVGDGELKASMETFRAREAARAAELASTGEHSPLAGHRRASRRRADPGRAAPGLERQVIRACCQVPPARFIAGAAAGTCDPELITVSLRRWRGARAPCSLTPGSANPFRMQRPRARPVHRGAPAGMSPDPRPGA